MPISGTLQSYMSLIELFLIALSLSLDAAAVAISAGAFQASFKRALKVALFFGIFQGVMPLLGWAAGLAFKDYVSEYGHIIGFVLLLGVGVKMLFEALKKEDDSENKDIVSTGTLTILAIATSIDALVVGITFNFVPVSIPVATILIGVVTFAMSLIGFYLGAKSKDILGSKIEIVGAVILVLLAFKILLF
ncbi:MAG: hypothetical protein JWN64_855 [Parcubacteria group bacterium]|nr:hypothetical protein [Parcubacteria group bacterium]